MVAMKKVIFSLSMCLLVPINLMAFELYQKYKPHLLLIDTNFEYYKSQTNFNDNNSAVSLNGENYFQKMTFQLQAEAALTSDLYLLAGIDINSTESNDGFYTRTNSAFSKSSFGINYVLDNEIWFRYGWQSLFNLNLASIDENSDAVPVSDGAHEFVNSVVLSFDFEDNMSSFLRVGYGLKNNQLNNFILFDVGLSKKWTNYSLGLDLNGKKSLGLVDNTSKVLYSNKVSGGSFIYNVANSDSIAIKPKLTFDFQNLVADFYVSYNIYGKNAPQGYAVGISLNWILDDILKKPILGYKANSSEVKKKVNFQEDTADGVNQNYFKTVNPEDQNYIQQIEGQPQGLKNATQPDQLENENQILKDEYLIKLKKKKK